MCLLNNSQAKQPLTSLHFHSASHRLLTQPPLYQTADDFILLYLYFPERLWALSESGCPAGPAALPALLSHRPQGLTRSRPDASAPDRPHGETTNQPFCPVTSAQMCCPPLTSQYLNKIPSRGVNLTPGVMRALLCSPQQLYTSHYRFPGNQISSVMNKSKAATNNRFHSHAINQSFLPSIVRNNYLCPSNQNRVSPE